MSEPERRTVRVRRSPKIGVFLALGAGAGALLALIATSALPQDPRLPTPQAFGLLVLLLAPAGALVAGLVAVIVEAVLARRAREVQAERLAPDRGVASGPGEVAREPEQPGSGQVG